MRGQRVNLALQFTTTTTELDASLTVTLPQSPDCADAAAFLAITESMLANRVTTGENRGVTLKHDHVVRTLVGPLVVESKDRIDGKWSFKRPFTLDRFCEPADRLVVAFVQNLRTGEVYQAPSAPVCSSSS